MTMLKPGEQLLPECVYGTEPTLIRPGSPTPNHVLHLSNLDCQKFLRFSIKYVYLFRKSVNTEKLKESLSRVLVQYYPLAGRLRRSRENAAAAAAAEDGDDHKIEVDCNGEGAVFAEATMELSADEFVEFGRKPNKSLRKLLYTVKGSSCFLDIPPLVIQVTNLRCGGMILCTAINHCICDGIGTSQFLHAWAHMTTQSTSTPPLAPFHSRHVLKPRSPPQVTYTHPGFTEITPVESNSQSGLHISRFLHSQPLVSSSITFSSSQILNLKRQCTPSIECTNFEVVASHTWRCWVKSLELPPFVRAKLLFSANVRKYLSLPEGYYGNGFVMACAEMEVKELIEPNLRVGVRAVQHAKSKIREDYVKSIIDLLDNKTTTLDLSTTMVISQWSKLGLEDLDFGEGKPLHMGPLSSEIFCLLLPICGDFEAIRVLVSLPENVIDKFQSYMMEFWGTMESGNKMDFYLELVSV